MRGRLIDISMGLNRKQRVTIELDADFREGFEALKAADVEVEIRKFRLKRSKDANAYFHVLVNKIAQSTGQSDEEVKYGLVVDYGAVDMDEDGVKVGFRARSCVDLTKFYKYAKCYNTAEIGGKLYKDWLVYKHTSDMDSGEMARLIDGAIAAAKERGIETDTPEMLARYKQEWGRAAPERTSHD